MFTDIFFEVSDHTAPFIVQKAWSLEGFRGVVLGHSGQFSHFLVWKDGCRKWQEICGLNRTTGDTLRTCEVTRNRVTVKYSYTCSRGRKHYVIIHESQLTGESWSETDFWLVFAVELLQELKFLSVFFSHFILLFPSSLISLSVLP
jgi:hypothetical protein